MMDEWRVRYRALFDAMGALDRRVTRLELKLAWLEGRVKARLREEAEAKKTELGRRTGIEQDPEGEQWRG